MKQPGSIQIGWEDGGLPRVKWAERGARRAQSVDAAIAPCGRAEKYRRDAQQYAEQRDIYAHSRSKWGQEQFARYARLAVQALEKALAYEREDVEAIAAIERDNERVDRAMMREERRAATR